MTREHSQGALGTRARILRAAGEIARGTTGEQVSVRAVAARAGVGLGTLRYHFPTQRELLDAVLASIYEEVLPDERIRDTSVPAADRLVQCLQQLVAPIGVDAQARKVWADLFRTFIAPEADAVERAGYLDLSRHATRRVESWLAILVEEGAVAAGDNAARARFLVVLTNGLALQRALPSEIAPLDLESEVLRAAVDRLLVRPTD